MSDLLDMMVPAGLDIDEEETLRARMGLVDTAPVAAFTGGYAESADEVSQRSKPKARKEFVSKASRGLRDVIITMPAGDKEEFAHLVACIRRDVPAYESTAAVVMAALRRMAA